MREGQVVLANMEKQNMCSVYGKTVCKDISDKYKFISKRGAARGVDVSLLKDWEEFGEQVLIRQEYGVFDKIKNTFPSIFGIYILAYSRMIVNRVVECIGGFHKNKVYYTDTDSLYI